MKRDFALKGAKALTLDLSKGPLAVVLHPAARKGGDTKADVAVAAIRGLTADEIIARERAWDTGQRERVRTYVAAVETSRGRIETVGFSLPRRLSSRSDCVTAGLCTSWR